MQVKNMGLGHTQPVNIPAKSLRCWDVHRYGLLTPLFENTQRVEVAQRALTHSKEFRAWCILVPTNGSSSLTKLDQEYAI